MKTLAVFCASLFLMSCASSGGLMDDRVLDCQSGQDLMVRVGSDRPFGRGGTQESPLDDLFNVLVEISNNSHNDVHLKHVRVEQYSAGGRASTYQFESGYKQLDEVLEEGKDITVEIPTRGRWMQQQQMRRDELSSPVEFLVSVGLANGDAYRCVFSASR